MKTLLDIDMSEATRLTREGRLDEAMALLPGALPSAPSPVSPPPTGTQPEPGPFPRAKVFLDMVPPSPETGGSWTAPEDSARQSAGPSEAIGRPDMPEAMREFLDRLGQPGSAAGLKGRAGLRKGRAPAPLPEGARFEKRDYANEAGTRAYKLYVPSGFTGQPLPLVVMLHGCTQSPDDFAAGTRMNEIAEEQTFLVAYPEQAQSANASKCWNWFSAADQQRDRGEPSLLAGITREIMRDFPVDAGRVYVAGLSAGGAAAAIMGATYPDLYAAVGVHSGLACGAASDLPSAFTAMRQGGSPGSRGSRVPTIVFHGDRDTTVSPVNADQVLAQSRSAVDLQTTVTRGEAPGGIRYTRAVEADETGRSILEHWVLHGAGHAWSGGSAAGTYTEPRGPDASREMMRFLLQHSKTPASRC